MKLQSGGKFSEFELNVALERLAEVETTMKVIENNELGKIKAVNSQIKTKPRRVRDWKEKVHKRRYVYRIEGDVKDLYKKLEKGDIDYRQFTSLGVMDKGDSYNMYKGYTYLEIKNPIIYKGLHRDEAIQGWSLLNATMDSKLNRYFDKYEVRLINEQVGLLHKTISDNYADVLRQLKATKGKGTAYVSEMFGHASTVDQHALDKFFTDWAGKDLHKKAELLDLVKHVIKPRHVSGVYTPTSAIKGVRDIPYVATNQRLLSEVFKWMSKKGFLEVDGDGLPIKELPGLHSMMQTWKMSSNKMKGGKDWDYEMVNRTMEQRELLYMKDYNRYFAKLEDTGHARLLSTLMSDINFYDPAFEKMLGDMDLLPDGSRVKFEQIKGAERETMFMGTKNHVKEILKGGCN
jgi:hypothetical protein